MLFIMIYCVLNLNLELRCKKERTGYKKNHPDYWDGFITKVQSFWY